jgi:anti-sigma regulatory factor (Ser/Thr protein kinase)
MGKSNKKAIFDRTRGMLARSAFVFSALMLIIYADEIWLNVTAQLNVRKQIIESVETQVIFIADSIYTELWHLHTQQLLLANDYAFQLLLLYNDLSDMSKINTNLRRIDSRYKAMMAISPSAVDIGFYLPRLERISKNSMLFAAPTQKDFSLLGAVIESNRMIIPYEDDLIMHIEVADTVCYIRLSGDRLRKILEETATPYNMSLSLYMDGEALLSTGNSFDGGSHLIRAPFPAFNMELVALLPVAEVNNVVIPTMILTIILFTAVLFGSVAFFTFYINRAMIRPVDKIFYEQQLAVEKARFKQLQSQITPHFLYNSFYQIYRLGKMGDTDLTSELSLQLSRYYQYITRDRDDIVPLHMEVEHARNYAAIQNIRFGSRITCVILETPAEYRDLMVPKLILQPLLENAYEHGLEAREAPSRISVSFQIDNDNILIRVENDGSAPDDEILADLQEKLDKVAITDETTGILNINQRLVYLYGGAPRLRVKKAEIGGFCAELSLKKEEEQDAAFTDN